MESDPSDHDLVADLRALGRSVPTIESDPDGTELATAVMARLTDVPPPRSASRWQPRWQPRWQGFRAAAGRRRRQILVVVAALLLGSLGVPGVRAAVVEWFTFDGVNVRIHPAPDPSVTKAPPPPTAHGTSLDRARRLVGFRVVTLPALGTPDGVEVSADRRLLSLTWDGAAGATIRLDEFDGTLDPLIAKTSPDVEWTSVGRTTALWFERPHEVQILDAAGNPRTETARLAGHTLIWEAGGTVLRLEGDFTRERAVKIAASAKPLR